jgi:CheY-like chemotaxis protein
VKVLVVDDDPTMRRLVVRLASRHPDVEVTEADNGVAALAAVEAQRPDIVITDVTMPYLDGLGLLEALRGSPAHRELPVVAVSAISDKALVLRMVDLGIEDYLLKPLDPATAGQRFDDLFARVAARKAAPGVQASTRGVLMLIDREPGYGAVLRAALGKRFEIIDDVPAAAAFAAAIAVPPLLVLVGQGLAMPSEAVIARTLRATGATKVALLTDHPLADGADAFDAVVQRTHVPQKLLASLEPLIAGLRDEGGQLAMHLAAVGADLGIACRQSLGILTSQESSLVEEGEGPSGEVTGVRVGFSRSDGDGAIALVLRMAATELATLAEAHNAGATAPDALLHAVAAPAAARVAHALAQRGWTVAPHTPATMTDQAIGDAPAARLLVRTEGGQLLEALLLVEPATAAAEAIG